MPLFDNLTHRWSASLDATGDGTTTLHTLDKNGAPVAWTSHGTLVNMTPATDWVDDLGQRGSRALFLRGGGQRVNLGAGTPLEPATMTLSLWVKNVGEPVIFDGIIGRSSTNSWTDGFGIWWDSPTTIKCYFHAYNTYVLTAAGAVPDQWNHVVVAWDGTNAWLYLNGVLVFSRAVPGPHSGTMVPLMLGRVDQTTSSSNDTSSLLDDVCLFNAIKTLADVQALHAGGRALRESPLNLTDPTLSINSTAWTGDVGSVNTQGNGTVTWEWELRRAVDDVAVESGVGNAPSGVGTYSGEYYLWRRASNDGGYDDREDADSRVQATLGQAGTGVLNFATSQAIALTGTQAGSAIVVTISQDTTTSATFAVSDDAGNTYTELVLNEANSGRKVAVWRANNVAAGNPTVTVTASASTRAAITASEVLGASIEAPVVAAEYDSLGSPHYCAPGGAFHVQGKSFVLAAGALNADAFEVDGNSNYTVISSSGTNPVHMVQYRETAAALFDERAEWTAYNTGRQGPQAIIALRGLGQVVTPPAIVTATPNRAVYEFDGFVGSPTTFLRFGDADGTNQVDQAVIEYAVDPTLIDASLPVTLTLQVTSESGNANPEVRRWAAAFPDTRTALEAGTPAPTANSVPFSEVVGTKTLDIKALAADAAAAGQSSLIINLRDPANFGNDLVQIAYGVGTEPTLEYSVLASEPAATALDGESSSTSTSPTVTIGYAASATASQSASESTSPLLAGQSTATPSPAESASEASAPLAAVAYLVAVIASQSPSQSSSPTASMDGAITPLVSHSLAESTSPAALFAQQQRRRDLFDGPLFLDDQLFLGI